MADLITEFDIDEDDEIKKVSASSLPPALLPCCLRPVPFLLEALSLMLCMTRLCALYIHV
jgi:hypothetical protein